ncbi:uncharacterized protein [Coffea arabica]|uniref:Uncharacterized protein n=1 Tax=Coffea arabica TaxID=13443 RepID=A0ABM4U508_COFAR
MRKQIWGDCWALIGDLNDITSNGEKWGGRARIEASFEKFNNFISRNSLVDIGFEGVPWTWCNNWDNEDEVKERLDKVIGTRQWCDNFRKVKCTHIETEASDHCALILDTTPVAKQRKRRFMFDKRWLMQEGVGDVVREAWDRDQQRSRLYKVQCKIKQVRVNLLNWSRRLNMNAKQNIDQIKREIKEMRESSSSDSRCRIAGLKRQLAEAHKREEIFWSQKARVKWLTEGDKNTSFFHASVMSRRRQNRISVLQRKTGEWCRTEEEICEEVVDYFQQLFTLEIPTEFDEILEGIPLAITAEMNKMLTRPVSDQEISHAVNSMHPNKSPGPDDDSLIFCRAEATEATQLMKVLDVYGRASGQLINKEKSSVFF